MSKKFIFLSGLFFLKPFFAGAMEQQNKLSALNPRTLHRILQRDPSVVAKIFKHTKAKYRKKLLYELKRVSTSQVPPRKGSSSFRYKPYPAFHKRKIVDLED
jgi:hypothetical protein